MRSAVILAGGLGTRLHPLTLNIPKPLLPLGDIPILDVVISQLRRDGFEHITLSLGYLGELFEQRYRDGSEFGINITYLWEEQPLGTAGCLSLLQEIPAHLLVMNGDILSDFNYANLLNRHQESRASVSIVCTRRTETIDYGVLEVNESGHLQAYREKPKIDFLVSCGVYFMEAPVVDLIGKGERIDLPDLVDRADSIGLVARVDEQFGYWQDIGRPSDYEYAQEIFAQDRDRFL